LNEIILLPGHLNKILLNYGTASGSDRVQKLNTQ